MADPTFALGFDPQWYFVDVFGRPLGGGYLASYSSLNNNQIKPIFKDPAGNLPYELVTIPSGSGRNKEAILLAANGTLGPALYFSFDEDNPSDLYFLTAYDAQGNLQWTMNNYFPSGGSGGSVITNVFNLVNLITNSVMYRNIGRGDMGVDLIPATTKMVLAPGANTGLANTPSNFGPDIQFIKNNSSGTDSVSFPRFTLGDNTFGQDITPVDYLRYFCTAAGAGETAKYVLFPLTSEAQNLTNQNVQVGIWAKAAAGTPTITLNWLQFYGDGPAASPPATGLISNIVLSGAWNFYSFNSTVPNASGKTIGECGNSGLFLQVSLPLNATNDIWMTKPQAFIGAIPENDYEPYDVIDGRINTPRTGDTRVTLSNFSQRPFGTGWVPMDDGTIGSVASLATTRASRDTFPLYNLLWNSIDNAWAPVTGGRGANAIDDFVNNKPISLTKALGRVFAGTLNTEVVQAFTVNTGVSTVDLTVPGLTTNFYTGVPVKLAVSGGSLPLTSPVLIPGATYYVRQISSTVLNLFRTPEDAIANTNVILLLTNGSGTFTIQVTPYALGQYLGEEKHTQTIAELAAHSHTVQVGTAAGAGCAVTALPQTGNFNSGTTGSSTPFNVIQPTTYMNVFIKL